jgi:hypothetical protein
MFVVSTSILLSYVCSTLTRPFDNTAAVIEGDIPKIVNSNNMRSSYNKYFEVLSGFIDEMLNRTQADKRPKCRDLLPRVIALHKAIQAEPEANVAASQAGLESSIMSFDSMLRSCQGDGSSSAHVRFLSI